MSAHFESAIPCLRPTSERRARTTAVATLAAAQNGTSGVLEYGKHACRTRALPTCRSALRPGWRRPSFWRVVLKSVGDTGSPTRSALTSVATPSPCGLRERHLSRRGPTGDLAGRESSMRQARVEQAISEMEGLATK